MRKKSSKYDELVDALCSGSVVEIPAEAIESGAFKLVSLRCILSRFSKEKRAFLGIQDKGLLATPQPEGKLRLQLVQSNSVGTRSASFSFETKPSNQTEPNNSSNSTKQGE